MKKPKARKTEKSQGVKDRYDSVLLEGIRSDFKVVAESVMLLQEKTDRFENRMDGFETRFDRLEDTLRMDFRTGLLETKQEIVSQISEKIDRFENRLSTCEGDIARIKEGTSPISS